MSDRTLMDSRYMSGKRKITGALKAVERIEAVEFSSLNGVDSRRRYGVVGQTVAKHASHAVDVDGMGHHYMQLDLLVPVLLAAVQELSAKVTKLEAEKVTEAQEEKDSTKS